MFAGHRLVPVACLAALAALADPASAQLPPACVSSQFTKSHTLTDPGSDGPTPGDVFHYSVTFCHGSGGNACVIEDNVPSSLTPSNLACSATPPPDACSLTGNLITVDYGVSGLPVGQCVTFTFDGTVRTPPPPLPPQICNQAYNADPNLPSPDLSNNDCELVTALPAMTLQKTATDVNGGALEPGDVIHYVLTVTNASGSIGLNNVRIEDRLPVERDAARTCPLAIQSPDIPLPTLQDDCPASPPGFVLSNFNLAPGQSARFELDVAIDCAVPDGRAIRNSALGSSDEIPAGPGQPSATAVLDVVSATISSVTKTPDQTTVQHPGSVTYTITVAASGSGSADPVRLLDDLTAQGMGSCFDLAGGAASCGACYNPVTGVLDAQVGPITQAAPATVTLTLPTAAAGTCSNRARATQGGPGGVCPPTNLDSPDASVTVTNPPPIPTFDTSTKDDLVPAAGNVFAGDPMNYRIVVTNSGSGAASNVTVTDVFPACLDDGAFCPGATDCSTQVSITPGPGSSSYNASARTLTVDLPSVGALSTQTIDIVGIAAGPANPSCCNQALVRHASVPAGVPTRDAEVTACPAPPCPTCTRIEDRPPACNPLPAIVNRLLAGRSNDDVVMQWDQAVDTTTAMYDVWKVVNLDKTLIPSANKANVGPNIVAAGTCTDIPRATPNCTESAVVAAPPTLVFYQVRGACQDGTEGVDHPF